MVKKYDHIIWGASYQGISKADELSQQSSSVLLLNKYGFPGGKITESLSCLFLKDEHLYLENLFMVLRKKRFVVLYEDNQTILIHPEAVKRTLWETLRNSEFDYLFHVIPISFTKNDSDEVKLFGRQGHLSVVGSHLHDCSAEIPLKFGNYNADFKVNMLIHCFISAQLPPGLTDLNIFRHCESPIGHFYSFSVNNVMYSKAFHVFNDKLDKLAFFVWKNFGARIVMVPVQPELIYDFNKADD